MITHKPGRGLLAAAFCTVVMTAAPVWVGAAGDTFKQSAELSKRMSKTSEDVDNYVAQLDKTEEALSSVSQAQSKDLKKRYESFSKEVINLEGAQKHTTADIDQMKSTGTQYFDAWDTSIAEMSNPELKQASVERRSKIMKEHDDLAVSLSDVGNQLPALMSDLHDLKTFMEADLSTETVGKAGGMIQKSRADSQALRTKIAGVQTMLKQFLSDAPK